MTLYGITGGIGMGKSTSARLLVDWHVPVVDTDLLARELVQPGQPALAEIVTAFGPHLLDSQGQLRRKALGEIVFASEEKRRQLESILHPRIRTAWLESVRHWRKAAHPAGAIVIPLLFETDAANEFDCVICVACQPGTQHKRLAARGWSPAEIDRRNASQWPVQKKNDAARHVIWTEPSIEIHAAQLSRILGRDGSLPAPEFQLSAKR